LISEKYKIREKEKAYFTTPLLVGDYVNLEGLLDVHVLDHKPLVKNWR